jgi:N6-adenosine-specific RNA methylase IME4
VPNIPGVVRFHEAASIFPLIQGDEFAELVADIQAHGLQEDITLHRDGSILDGRNRYRACRTLGIDPRFKTWKGTGSELQFVLSLNLRRRHLSTGQRAALGVDLLPAFQEEARQRQRCGRGGILLPIKLSEAKGEAAAQVAKLVMVSPAYVRRASALKSEFPDLFAQVRSGMLGLNEAMWEVKESSRKMIVAANQRLVRRTRPLPVGRGKYRTIVIDPPWPFANTRWQPSYATMPVEKIAALQVGELAEDDAHVYLWIVNSHVAEGVGMLERWGFRYVTMLTWIKPSIGMGSYFRNSTEHVLFGVRGTQGLLRDDVATHFAADRPGQHSAKPDAFYKLVESCSPGPWIDLFARRARNGWASWGAELRRQRAG